MQLGVDYASVDNDASPDLQRAKAAGLRFAFIRGSYAGWADPTAARDRERIRAAGLVYGAYCFPVMAASAPTAEEQVATFVLAADLQRGKDFAPVLDLEWPGGIAKTGKSRMEIVDWIDRAITAMQKAYGCLPIIYSSARVLDGDDADGLNGVANNVLVGCPLWLARYPFKTRIAPQLAVEIAPPPTPKFAGATWHIHQFQGDAIGFPGFNSTVDIDRFSPLEQGISGGRVAWLQQRVGCAVDGSFGPATEMAVRAFQESHGLAVTGTMDVATFAALSWI